MVSLSSEKKLLEEKKIIILFLAADPTDAARLRLGQELRDIRERLQLSKCRERFILDSRESVRSGDIGQAILDLEPDIVHFSGHGTSAGELCLENLKGEIHAIPPDALAALFELVANQVICVVLNACYSEIQARAISQHIRFVIGMNKAIGDKAAIAFSNGFYKALGANCSIHKAYKFGCAEIRLQGVPEHLTPIFYGKPDEEVSRSQVKYELVLSATFDSIDEPLLNEIVKHLKFISGDTSIILRTVKAGSVILEIEGSQDGFELLESLFSSGALTEVLGLPVQKLDLLTIEDIEKNGSCLQAGGQQLMNEIENRENWISNQASELKFLLFGDVGRAEELNLMNRVLFAVPTFAIAALSIAAIFLGVSHEVEELYRGTLTHPLAGIISSIFITLMLPFIAAILILVHKN